MRPVHTSVIAAVIFTLALVASPALAEREHTVRAGQNLSRIARRYGVAVTSLAAANRLRPDAPLREGQVLRVPEEGVVVVSEGQTLGAIARRHDVTIEELARVNGLRREAALRVGQELLLPGHQEAEEDHPSARDRTWGRPRSPGIVTLMRLGGSRQRVRMRLVDARGRARRAAISRLSALMRPAGMRRPPRLAPRLLTLLTRVSDHFGGRPIQVVSGFRSAGGYTRETSRHTRGHAIDIRVEGVPNPVLRDFCRRFSDAGVGYYPRSTFVHLDVRDRSAYWVDWSRPGQAPVYRRPSSGPPVDVLHENDEPGEAEDEGLARVVSEAIQPDAIVTVDSAPKPPSE